MLRQKLLSHIAEIFPRSESFSVSLISGFEKVWIVEEGEVSRFPSNLFVSHCRKISFVMGIF